MNDKIKIILLTGGISPEREISKASCKSIYQTLCEIGYDVTLIDPALGKNQHTNIDKYFEEDNFEVAENNFFETFNLDCFNNVDLVFNGLHGGWGEDGHVQAILDIKNIKYTGSGVLASAIGMDKHKSKILFEKNGVKTAPWLCVGKEYNLTNIKEFIEKDLHYPCIIKPNAAGSTVGLTYCENESTVKNALDLALKYSDFVLIEKFIKGREVTVGIIGETTLPILEIKPKKMLYDFECKYTSGMSEYEVPAKIEENVYKFIQELGEKAYHSLGCQNYARVDFLLTENNEVYCLEANTLPGMTSHSLVPKMAKYIGIDFHKLCQTIVELALK